jgi:hypothetical protein
MTTRKFAALTLAAAMLSAPLALTAQAATQAHAPVTHHHTAKPAAAHRTTKSHAARSTASGDNSADALNAQSLNRARGQQ